MERIAINTLGCKVNQYESSCIVQDFVQNGYELVPFTQEAEIYVINTCTVTARTDFKSRNAIRQALRRKEENSKVKVIVTGCYSQLNKLKIESLGDIDLIIDNNHKGSVFSALNTFKPGFSEDPVNFSTFEEYDTGMMFERARAFIKIQDGCDYYCSYCTVPLARGKPRSRDPEYVIKQIERLIPEGYKEFVLTGINLGLYGRDLKAKTSLAAILKEVEKLQRVLRIRLSSIEPQLFSEELIAHIKTSKKICPHFHIPLQSGADNVLERMGRPYIREDFAKLLQDIVTAAPTAAIGTDIIAGFPGESSEDHEETIRFVKTLPLAYAHVFPYSSRPGTEAAKLKDKVAKEIVKQRCRHISEVVAEKTDQYIATLVKQKVLLGGVLEETKGEYWTALSDHYVRIYLLVKNEKSRHQKKDFISFPAYKRKGAGIEVKPDD
jgi:threonylcarbamoyladenosine tRNA methylthiotransferase MtaB